MSFEKLTDQAQQIAEILWQRKETVAVSESSGGGLISAALLAVPGASKYFMGGGVVYTHRAMKLVLDINLRDREGIRSSSEPYASLAAEHIRTRLRTTWGLCETGAAGPNGNSYGDASGHTCIAVSGPVSHVMTLETGKEDRVENMWLFAEEALRQFHGVLSNA